MASQRARYRPEVPVKPEPSEAVSASNHSHKQPRAQVIRHNISDTLLAVACVALLILTYQVYKLQQGQAETTFYLGDARDRRDTQNEELNARINAAVCSVLDRLPAGELFDPARAEYGCGPGIPVDELDPAAAQNLADILGEIEDAQPAATSEPAPLTSAPDEMPPGAPPGARPSPMGEAPTEVPAPTTAAPVTPAPTAAPTSTPPLLDLTEVTEGVCGALGICL